MRSAIIARVLLVLGLATVLFGALLRRQWRVHNDMETLGVVAVLATGFFAALIGLYLVLRDPAAVDEHRARRQRFFDRTGWQATIAPLIAGGLMLGYFALTDRWAKLDNPVASQLALFAGIAGALIAALSDRITRWGRAILPVALLVGLLAWGDRLPLESESTSRGEMVTLLVIVIVIAGVAINFPQIARGRRRATEETS